MGKKINKLVRDNIVALIRKTGKQPQYYVAEAEEYNQRLLDKMLEELAEFKENPCIEEAADMYEVLMAVIERWGLDICDVIKYAENKKKEKGGFFDGHILTGVVDEISE